MPTGDTGNVYTVNTATGLATIGPALTGSPIGTGVSVSAASLNPTSGVLFASLQAAPGRLVTVNPATGVITNVGATVAGIDAIEFGPLAAPVTVLGVPTLSQWMLLVLFLGLGSIGALYLKKQSGK